MKKLTKTNFKTFLKKNSANLLVRTKSSFDGMVDGCMPCDSGFKKAVNTNEFPENKYGYKGIWLVGGGRDYFCHYEDDNYIGMEVSNCCGHFIVATYKKLSDKPTNLTEIGF